MGHHHVVSDLAVLQAREDVSAGRWLLMRAQLDLDQHGYASHRLDDIIAHTSILLSDWAGRRRPTRIEDTAMYMKACREWRRRNGRSY
jgi:hypothetical protein